MSDNKLMELSAEELDVVAGGAVSLVDASNLNALDEQVGATNVGADGGITSLTAQKTAVSKQELKEIKVTGGIPGIAEGFFS